jgi:ATP-dependent exoDNAse (exonuclease V) beta subunit
VLFKSTVSQNVVERYFRLFGIPYTASSTAGLYAESVLGDLYAMLRLVVYPDDRLAFASVLRGPFARLSDDSVFAVLSPGSAGPDGLLGFDPAALAPDEAARFAAARATWQGLRERADREPLRRLVEYLWYDRGLRWSVQKDPSQAAFLEHFDYAWTMAAAADSRGERLVDLVASLEARMGKLERYDEGPVARESSRGVSIMTVHLSKGLEFPVVILPDLDNIGRNTPSEPIARDGRFGPSIRLLDPASTPRDPVDAFDRALRKIEKGEGEDAMNESLAETARLCYVACTRAISRLYLVGKVPRNADKSGRSFRGLLLRAWPWAGPASASDEEFLSDRPDDAPASFSVAYVEPRTQADWYTLVSGSRCDGRQLAAGETGEAQPAGAEGLSDVDFGTLCHQILESVLGRPDEEPKPRGAVAAALERLPAQARKASLQSALDLARTFALSPRGIAAAAARDAARAGVPNAVFRLEYPFVWRGQARPGQPLLLSGAMDLVYGNGEGMVVIDFKTDRVINPARHAFQLSVYRDAAESIFGLPAKAYVSYLRDGSEQEVSGLPDITDLDGHCA